MTQRASFPGLAGSAPRSFMGRAALGPPPVPAAFDFTLSNTTVTTSWATTPVGTFTPIGVDASDFEVILVESTASSGDEAGLAVVNG